MTQEIMNRNERGQIRVTAPGRLEKSNSDKNNNDNLLVELEEDRSKIHSSLTQISSDDCDTDRDDDNKPSESLFFKVKKDF